MIETNTDINSSLYFRCFVKLHNYIITSFLNSYINIIFIFICLWAVKISCDNILTPVPPPPLAQSSVGWGLGLAVSQTEKFPNEYKHHGLVSAIFTTSVSLGKGRGQQAAIKMMDQVQEEAMPNGPIRAEQVNRSSSVIGWQNRGQAGTSACTVVQCSCIHSSTGPECTENGLQYKRTAV